ncbi:hypothetical protein GA0070624_4663 [Micromonospora rhizosphaerae]|uniref:HEAT repeat-containing protein n=1 Tax=Micromonospora rhizosphaerae TaxID=568872 RepID=A0A1C6SV46_9ACTN|nr:hypothetical protein [Micromonospora rhizosphaerae]SCL33133.1 hypothetical protein GA0070624_4663 [Micromonospora rhizosphaerae]
MRPGEARSPATVEEWRRWRRDIFGDPYLVWHDGPEFSRLLRVARDDPGMVRRMLAAGLEDGDPVAAESVAVLAEAGLEPRGASHLLRAAVPTASGSFLVELAVTLHRLSGDDRWAEPIVSVLGEARHWGTRMDAAIALDRFPPTVTLIGALGGAVRDREYLVRYHAANTLLRYARTDDDPGRPGRRVRVEQEPRLFALIATSRDAVLGRSWRRRAPSEESRWREAADELCAHALARIERWGGDASAGAEGSGA